MKVIDLAQHFDENLNRGEQITIEWLASTLSVNTRGTENPVGLLGDYSCNHTVRISAKTHLFHYEFMSTLSTSLINGHECMKNGKLSVLNFMPTFFNDREVIQSYPARLFTVSNLDNITGTNDDELMAAITWLNAFSNKTDENSFEVEMVDSSEAIINDSYNVLAGSGGFGTPEYQLRCAITNKANRILQDSESNRHDRKTELMYAVYNMHNQGMSSVINCLADLLSNTAIPNYT
ncbi:hypothetical protein ES754_01345 [Psychrobacter frigidicola]|uniref:Uncharacterized protein n=1 Tax=Psychrobacter frigidicola TaxID=45611 RepID=A0A5C7A3K5_9GAMM|nr:hypothetical protein [Psychrobacter frigidicola]TXD97658.1 hypothetical protein ES754_01345 [Psychrobacter frigidicola]